MPEELNLHLQHLTLTNNTFTNQQFIKRPMEFTILYSGIMISMMRMSLSLLTRKLLKQNDLVLENVSASEQNYANGRQTATISVGNEGVKDASGFTVDVYEG